MVPFLDFTKLIAAGLVLLLNLPSVNIVSEFPVPNTCDAPVPPEVATAAVAHTTNLPDVSNHAYSVSLLPSNTKGISALELDALILISKGES